MSQGEKIKKTIMIAVGFALSAYLIKSGLAMLEIEKTQQKSERVKTK